MAPAILRGLGGVEWSDRGPAQPPIRAPRLSDNSADPEAVPKCECGLRTAIKKAAVLGAARVIRSLQWNLREENLHSI